MHAMGSTGDDGARRGRAGWAGRLAAGVAALLAASSAGAVALPPPWSPRTFVEAPGDMLRIEGDLGAGLIEKVERFLRDAPPGRPAYLLLDSPGGLLGPSMRAAWMLERHPDLHTHISGDCASACVALFMAGDVHTMAPGALLGVHQSSPADESIEAVWTGPDAEFMEYLALITKNGGTRDLVEHALATPGDDIYEYDALRIGRGVRGVRVVDAQGRTLERGMIRWEQLIDLLQARSAMGESEAGALAVLMRGAAERERALVLRHGDRAWARVARHQMTGEDAPVSAVAEAVAPVLAHGLAKAVRAAPDDVAARLLAEARDDVKAGGCGEGPLAVVRPGGKPSADGDARVALWLAADKRGLQPRPRRLDEDQALALLAGAEGAPACAQVRHALEQGGALGDAQAYDLWVLAMERARRAR